MHIAVFNAGSSSVKSAVFDMRTETLLAEGRVEGIGGRDGSLLQRFASSREAKSTRLSFADHRAAFEAILVALFPRSKTGPKLQPAALSHRVVHGGAFLVKPTVIDADVIGTIEEMDSLAPLHNAASLVGIALTAERFPDVPQLAVFDTAFHHDMPAHAFLYGIPYECYETRGIRRFGFHGISHRYVATTMAANLDLPLHSLKIVSLHLGSGASAAAILGGRSVDSSMGLTPLEGLMMGTRCGDIDPGVPLQLARAMPLDDVERLLYEKSGLRGVCGTSDMRRVQEMVDAGDERATLALNMFCSRVKKYIGAYLAVLGGADAIVFTGGIGERSHQVRARSCAGLAALGIELDPRRNENVDNDITPIHREGRGIPVYVVRSNEELEIARQVAAALDGND